MWSYTAFILYTSSAVVFASPIEPRQQSVWDPYTSCISCFRSSWTQGPECTTDQYLQATISRVLNPPASAASTYTPKQWCSDYLLQTDWAKQYTTTSMVNTYVTYTVEHYFVTTTDYDHPTSTMYCPSPSPKMECGWDSNTVAPLDQQEDWSIEYFQNPEQCQQLCLEREACKAYRLDGKSNTYCEIFNLGLGVNASNVISPTPNGNQWWDRSCQDHVPAPCRSTSKTQLTARPTPPPTAPPAASTPVLTTDTPPQPPTPTSLSHVAGSPAVPSITPRAVLEKRDAPFPSYLEDLSYVWSSLYMVPACSCIISSEAKPTLITTTRTVTEWTASTTVTSTIEDWFRVTETVRQTTLYLSVE